MGRDLGHDHRAACCSGSLLCRQDINGLSCATLTTRSSALQGVLTFTVLYKCNIPQKATVFVARANAGTCTHRIHWLHKNSTASPTPLYDNRVDLIWRGPSCSPTWKSHLANSDYCDRYPATACRQ